ncbi:MAG: hypothetical protein ABSG80_11815 [Verrucomicrobiota bacterium]|jgi:hypothetical protein
MTVVRGLAVAGMFLYVFSRFIPCNSVDDYPIIDGIENAWAQALHVAFSQHWQFGQDIVFTYGPWGFLARGYYPPTYPVSVIAWIILSLVYLCAVWRLACHLSDNRLVAGLWLVGFTAIASIPVGDDFNTRLVAWGVLLLFLHFFVEKCAFTPIQALLAVSLGWLSLVKFTGLMESAMLVAVVAADNIFRHRRFPWIVPLYVASLMFFWVAAGQYFSSLGPFLCNSWRITGGYTEAMMLTGKAETRDAICFLLIAVLLCALTGRVAWSRTGSWGGSLLLAGLGTILFIVFKLGYVRNDRHEITSAMALLLISLACFALAWPGGKRAAGAASCLLIASTLFASSVFNCWLPGDGLWKQIAGTFSIYNLFAPVAGPFTGYLRSHYENNLAIERKANPLPSIGGNADLYSHDQTILFAHVLSYQPRPIIQSYSAYTPELAKMNAAHLRTARAASNILFAVQPLDGRFPSLDDGRSWPELLTLYDLKGASDDKGTFLLLSRAAVARKFQLIPLQNTSARFGEPVTLPDATNGPVWVEIEIKKSLAGIVVSTLYKPPVLMLTVLLQDHTERRFRLVPGMAGGGFLLSPLIADNRSFAKIASTGLQDLAGLEVVSMTISAGTGSGATRCYQSPMPVRFCRLDYPLQDFNINWPVKSAEQ